MSYRNVLRREWQRIKADRVARMLLCELPLGAMLFFVLFFGSGTIRNLPMTVIDDDHTPQSRQLVRMMEAMQTLYLVAPPASTHEAERWMRSGLIDAFLLIPHDFSRHLEQGSEATVISCVSGANLSTEGMIAKAVEECVATFSAGVQLTRFELEGMSQREARNTLRPIRIENHILFNPTLNYGNYLAPIFLPMMLIILSSMSTIYAVGSELRNGTCEAWLTAADNRIGCALIGKLTPVILSGWVMIGVMIWLWHTMMGIPIRGSLMLLIFASVLLLAAYQSIALLLVALTADLRLALSLGGGYAVMAFTFSGMTFPLQAMWSPFRLLSAAFPFTPYMHVVVDQLMRGAPWRYSTGSLWLLIGFVVLPWVALPRLKQVTTDPKYRGRS